MRADREPLRFPNRLAANIASKPTARISRRATPSAKSPYGGRWVTRRWVTLPVLLVVSAGTALSGCSSSQASESSRLESWIKNTNLGESIGLIHGDDIAVSTFVSQHKGVAAIRAACAEMQDDAATAAANLPSPDLQLTQVLSGAFNEYIAAAGDCFNGAGGDQTDLSHSAHERVLADAAIARAVARISSVTGKVPPTTTTTQPPPGGGL